MENVQKGSLFVFTGPSGAGKGTVLSAYFARNKGVSYSISATTRKPRAGEVDGVNYYFISRQRFEEMIAENCFLEYTEYSGNYYGTPEQPVEEQLLMGNNVILEIDMNGAIAVKKRRQDAVMVFILPPTFGELERRLRKRATESESDIKRRLSIAKKEYEAAKNFDYIVLNSDIDKAVLELESIVLAERCKTKYREYLTEVV